MTHFDDLFWLVAVVDEGTLSAAAGRHGVTAAAVSKRLRLLEERLSVRLLERNARRLRTTEAGELYYQQGKRLLEAFNELEENVAATGEMLQGTIRINAPHSYALQRLSKPVAAFMDEHPRVNVHLDLDDRFIDINEANYDVVIRIGQLADSAAIAQRIDSTQLLCCAAPSYLSKSGHPTNPEDLREHDCLIYDQQSQVGQWTLSRAGVDQTISVGATVHSNDGVLLTQLAEQGRGIVMQPCFIVADALAKGSLVPVLPNYEGATFGVYAIYPSKQYLPEKISRLIAFLKNALN